MGQGNSLEPRPDRPEERRLPARAEGRELSRLLFRVTLVFATSVALVFLVLPVVAIFARVPPGELVSALGTDAAKDALVVTAKTNAVSMFLILAFGTPTAYWIATRSSRLRDLVVTLVELPLVLPPAVAGIGLLAAFGRLGLLGGSIEALGIDIAFTQTAVVLAVTFVASPFYVRTAVSAFEAVDPTLPAAARTLGAGPARVFGRVSLPLAAGGLGAGAALAFARGIGEFGATIMFAGSLQGSTQTLSLAIYEQFDLDFDVALAISAVLVAISGGVLLSVKVLTRWRSGSTTPIPFAPSTRTSS
jgi:molybdate transport system permease protein